MKRKVSLMLIATLTVCAALLLWQQERIRAYENRLQLAYSYALNEVEGYVAEIEDTLLISAVTHDPYEIARLSTKLHTYSNAAISAMGQLPIFDTALDKTALFLTQTGEFGHAVSLRHLSDGILSDTEQSQLASLASYAGVLRSHLNTAADELRLGTLSFEKFLGGHDENFSKHLYDTESDFKEYPEIVYEGTHSSDSVVSSSHADLYKERLISEEEAKKSIHALCAVTPNTVSAVAGTPATFAATINHDTANTYIAVTQNGGKLATWMQDRLLLDATMDMATAESYAEKFLNLHGYYDFTLLTKHDLGTEYIYSYAATQEGVVLYPDLLRVKVAADNGEITGFDATGYLANHHTRAFNPPIYSLEQALSHRADLSVQTTRLAVIPTATGKEILCHEIIGTKDDKTFYLYVNCATGREEELFLTEPTFY